MRQGLGLVLLILVQSFAALFFLSDMIVDWMANDPDAGVGQGESILLETLASLTLVASVVVEVRLLIGLLRQQEQLRRGMQIASGALHQVIEAHYRDWGLTPSERDVAGFAIKGASIAEIALLRETAQGTVKAHLNAIYRKAGVSGRSELVSLLIEDLLSAPLVDPSQPKMAQIEQPQP